jgi:hypothetical protein
MLSVLNLKFSCLRAFNEGGTLQDSVERYKALYGFYPSRILADKIYRTRDNLAYCKNYGIAMSGPKLGRPPKDKNLYREQCLAERNDAGKRNAIEGEFGTEKRKYGLDRIMTRLKDTSEAEINLAFLSLNLWKRVRVSLALFFALFFKLLKIVHLGGLGIGSDHKERMQRIMAAV